MDRKIIQIVAADASVVALCDDGSLWRFELQAIPWARINPQLASPIDESDF